MNNSLADFIMVGGNPMLALRLLLGTGAGNEAIGWVAKLIMFIIFMCCVYCYCYSLLCLVLYISKK